MTDQKLSSEKKEKDHLTFITDTLLGLGKDFALEYWRGLRTGAVPWHLCSGVGIILSLIFMMRWDALPWRWLHAARYYPFHPILYWPYAAMVIMSGFWLWGLRRVAFRRRLVERLSSAFRNAGLQTRMGRLPGFISDYPLDRHMRKLVLSNAGIPDSEFKKAKEGLEASLQIVIEQMKTDVQKGQVSVIYAHGKMGEHVDYDPCQVVAPLEFTVGATRSSALTVSLKDVPHLLIAGYTNSGKSTFLRQMLATLILKNPGLVLSLIDLKRGLEFQVFHGLPNVDLSVDAAGALRTLKYVEGQLEKRMELLWANKVNDLTAYFKVPESKRQFTAAWPKGKAITRHIVVIDEAAELFLAGAALSSKDAQAARRSAAKIAALGRAVGIHLIIATQRPDRNAIDPLIKTNLQGRLCFQMADNASSMTILDSARAADLPQIKGRAIWRSGFDLTEVQVPWLSREALDTMLVDLKPKEEKGEAVVTAESATVAAESTPVQTDAIELHDQGKADPAPAVSGVQS